MCDSLDYVSLTLVPYENIHLGYLISATNVTNTPAVSGWVVLDRSGRHFGLVLNFLRDGSVPLPEDHKELDEVLKEAQYYRVQGLVQHCLSAIQVPTDVKELLETSFFLFKPW